MVSGGTAFLLLSPLLSQEYSPLRFSPCLYSLECWGQKKMDTNREEVGRTKRCPTRGEKKRNDGKEEETRLKRGVAKHPGQDGLMGLATLTCTEQQSEWWTGRETDMSHTEGPSESSVCLGLKEKCQGWIKNWEFNFPHDSFFFNLSFSETRLCCVFQGGFKLEISLPYRRVNTENS